MQWLWKVASSGLGTCLQTPTLPKPPTGLSKAPLLFGDLHSSIKPQNIHNTNTRKGTSPLCCYLFPSLQVNTQAHRVQPSNSTTLNSLSFSTAPNTGEPPWGSSSSASPTQNMCISVHSAQPWKHILLSTLMGTTPDLQIPGSHTGAPFQPASSSAASPSAAGAWSCAPSPAGSGSGCSAALPAGTAAGTSSHSP